jgi:multicomponent Na+:H+ antiporter subunit E
VSGINLDRGAAVMTVQILLNLIIGLVWMLLHDVWDFNTFVIGYFIGLLIVFGLRRFFPGPFYGKRFWAILKLLYLFIREMIMSTIVVIRQVTRPRLNIQPGIFRMETGLKSDWEMTLLAALITLTPGSVVMEVAPEEGVMYVHAMDASEFVNGVLKSKRIFEEAILEVTN